MELLGSFLAIAQMVGWILGLFLAAVLAGDLFGRTVVWLVSRFSRGKE